MSLVRNYVCDCSEYSGYTTTMNVSDNSTVLYDALLPVPSNCSTGFCANTTTMTTTSNYALLLPIGVIIVIVLAAACLLLGVVYGYVYFTRMTGNTTKKSRHKSASCRQQSNDHHHHHHHRAGNVDVCAAHRDDPDGSYTTHMFLFRKHNAAT